MNLNKDIEEKYKSGSPEDQVIKESEKGNYLKLSQLLESNSNEFSQKTIDEAFRMCIRNFKNQNEEYLKCFQLFLNKIQNINFQNEKEGNSTALMEAINLGQVTPAELIISCFKNSEGEQKLNLNAEDDMGENCVFKLIKSPKIKSEDERYELFKDMMTESIDIHHENKEGYTLLSYALLNGNSQLSEELIRLGSKRNHIISSNGENLLHCAVRGKNPLCVSLLQTSNLNGFYNDRVAPNKNGETPYDLATKMSLTHIVKIISETKSLSIFQLLEEFTNKNYIDVIRPLSELKDNQKCSNMSLDWNMLLAEFMNEYEKEKKKEGGNESTYTTYISSNSSTQKITITSNSFFDQSDLMLKKPNIITSFYKQFVQFFSNIFGYNKEFAIENPILALNHAILCYKLGDFKSMYSLLSSHLPKFVEKPDWMLYLNAAFLSIDSLLYLKQVAIAGKILAKLDEALSRSNSALATTITPTSRDIVSEYLNSREIINKSPLLDDIYCILALYKALKFSIEDKIDEAKKCLQEYKRISTTSKFKEQLTGYPVFNTLKVFYHCLKIKLDYQNNFSFKCYNHLNRIFASNGSNDMEYALFYYNNLGIFNLKQKKYKLAEYFFKQCLRIISGSSASHHLALLKIITQYRPCIIYNIGLCHFYYKKYEKAYKIFKSLSTMRNVNANPFLYYRIGLCCLERELSSLKSIGSSVSYNDFIDKFIGYSRNGESPTPQASNSCENMDEYNSKNINSFIPNGNSDILNIPQLEQIKRIILRYSSPSQNWKYKINNERLHEAVMSFRHALLLLKDNIYNKREISSISFLFPKSDDISEQGGASPPYIKNQQSLFVSTYINMLFSLLLREQWSEVIFYGNEFEKTEYYTREVGYIIDNYLIEAHLALNQVPQVLEILKKNMLNNNFNYNSIDCKGTFFNSMNNCLYSEINYKLALYINIIKMNFMNGNLLEVEKGIISIVNLMNINLTMNNGVISHNDLPQFFINLLVYYYIIKESYEMACYVIKKRKIPLLFAQSILQPLYGKNPIVTLMK